MRKQIKFIEWQRQLVKLHPKFLEILGQLQPLIVVVSLCIMIAAFLHGISESAVQYALYAAVCFFLSLTFSIFTRIYFYPDRPAGSHYALATYIMTALGFAFLFTVIISLQEIAPYVGKLFKASIYVVLGMVFFTIFRFSLSHLWRILEEKRYKGTVEKIFLYYLWVLAAATAGLVIFASAIDMLDGWEEAGWIVIIASSFYFCFFIPAGIFYVWKD